MTVAMYLRLSSEDIDLKSSDKTESESISNQRGLLKEFLRGRPEFAGAEILEFCDDGWSGKNFERPAFLQMMEQVKTGKIHCIVVKDLSRFGRDYLVVGNYISRVFPFLGVRFIAVNDGFDSTRQADIDSLDTSFKTLIYDLYSRELSQKVKSAKRQRAAKGLFLSPFAPYGYRKDPRDKNHLIPDPEAAAVVQRIFRLASEKHAPKEIASILNADGIPSPMRYKQKSGCSRERWPSIHEHNFWTRNSLYTILRDERYLGTAVYGKRERDMVGLVHSVKKTKADWITVAAAHEGIIEPELFQAAQAELKAFSEKDSPAPNANPLRRKVICGCCGYAMQLVKAKTPYYRCCSAELGLPYGCKTEPVSQTDIQDAVLALIRTYAQCAVDLDRLQAEQRQRIRQAQKRAEKALTALQNRRQQLELLLQNLYEQLIDGSTDRAAYFAQKQKMTAQLQELTEKEAGLKAAASVSGADTLPILERYRQYTELDTLTPSIAKELVQRVVVYPDSRLEVYLNCRDELEEMLAGTIINNKTMNQETVNYTGGGIQ